MSLGRLLARLCFDAENLCSILSKSSPPCATWFSYFNNTTLDIEELATKVNTGNRNNTQALTGNSKDSSHARQENEAVNHDKDRQNNQPPSKQTNSAKEASPMCYLYSETVKNTLQNTKHAFVMFHDPWHRKSTKSQFLKSVDLFVDELLAFDAVQEHVIVRCDESGVLKTDRSCYFDKLAEDHSSGRKEAELVSFIHSQTAACQKAKNAREAGFGGSVFLAFDDNFEDTIADPQPTFVMFFASFCDHCVAAKPAYSKLATTLKGDGKMKAIAIDAADNPKVADLAGIQTLPTFKMYKAGKMIEEYTGGRSYDDLLSFCKKHA